MSSYKLIVVNEHGENMYILYIYIYIYICFFLMVNTDATFMLDRVHG